MRHIQIQHVAYNVTDFVPFWIELSNALLSYAYFSEGVDTWQWFEFIIGS